MLESVVQFLGPALGFLAVLLFLHHLAEAASHQSRWHGEDGYAQYAHQAGDNLARQGDGRRVGEAAGVADILSKGPHHRAPAVVVDLRLCLVLHEEEDERKDERHDGQELQRHPQFAPLAADGLAQHSEGLHVAEHAHQTRDTQRLEQRVRNGQQESDVEGVGRQNVDEPVERAAVAHPAPEASVFGVEQVGAPDAQRHLDGEEHRGEDVDGVQPVAVALVDAVEGGEKHLHRAHHDEAYDNPVDDILPLSRAQVVVEDEGELSFQFMHFFLIPTSSATCRSVCRADGF